MINLVTFSQNQFVRTVIKNQFVNSFVFFDCEIFVGNHCKHELQTLLKS